MSSYYDCIKIASMVIMVLVIPGPTNTLLVSSGYSHGFIITLRLMLAEMFGYLIAISLWGLLLSTISHAFVWLIIVLKLFAAVYIAYLAFKVWHFSLGKKETKVHFSTVLFTTVLNPKAFVFATYVFPLTAFTLWSDYISSMTTFVCVLLPVSLIWVGMGKILYRGGRKVGRLKPNLFYRFTSLVLSIFSFSMFYTSMKGVLYL
ncbi:LysE family transporter [Photorhabdus temperata subsp. temperata]|uniref:Putative threonine efflux protein n=1 Tax=Photorhabdus temperata subsp. temperata Meg1 TaxID=1393735 RepID=A0A081S1Y8_PHOTE|nr:LysE family transporter [Photorhabdus temperata]KER04941.1 putative threonine efflux protein [Photorhabdus temperata subsp. temperata Meg1]